MRTLRTIAEVRETVPERGVGLVPTMGALHAGHLALFEAARHENDVVVASIFVNPAQFGESEDFERYPRDQAADAAVAEAACVDFLFVPSVEEMYPEGFETWVDVEGLSAGLEGAARPGHFRGVATVCLKLFNIVHPERAYFGQKDAQQAAIVERLAEDLNLELEIRVVPTVREEDGLAVSSRNAYLSGADREAAAALPKALRAGEEAHGRGADPLEAARKVLAGEPRLELEYVELARLDGRVYLLAAGRAGRTRLIDNVVLEGDPL
ncbi:MAG TPA: pantoate--beta-alanine ligase [Gaiellaceae bacterium]|nr:pantoate--beta-alanine ligase [Gaiellaceae bacterium]